jgi:hypothetical protein
VLHCAIDIALQCQIYVASAKTKGRASSDRRIFPNERLEFQISTIREHLRRGARHGANKLSTARDASRVAFATVPMQQWPGAIIKGIDQ